ncbi:MAG: hypothetical protein NUW08_00840, partial [Candidatus Uhrbacteria bacterium]|nr:hypothetical protein [Candidatus Uhrbacteria bacterium]
YDDWDGVTFASGYSPDAEPPTRKIKVPFPDGAPRVPRSCGALHDLERLENAIFADDEPKT